MGFFGAVTAREGRGGRTRVKEHSTDVLHQLQCKVCPLRTDPVKIQPGGSDDPTVYILGETPGDRDREKQTPFSGSVGQVLWRTIPKRWHHRVRTNNIIRTRPANGQDPTWQAVECCRPSVRDDIAEHAPKILLALGTQALHWLAPGAGSINDWRGRRLPVVVGDHTCWVYPIMHPSYILRSGLPRRGVRNPDPSESRDWFRAPLETNDGRVFMRDIERALKSVRGLDTPHVTQPGEMGDGVEIYDGSGGTSDLQRIQSALQAMANQTTAVDIETNCLRPYKAGSKLLSIAVSTGDRAVAFALDHRESKWPLTLRPKLDVLVNEYLASPGTKVAHNVQFEMEWFLEKYDRDSTLYADWSDTMVQAFVLDERRTGLSLDSLCLQYFGFNLKDISKLNRKNLDTEPLAQVLPYNAWDAKYTALMHEIQHELIEVDGLQGIYAEQVRRLRTLVLSQSKGVLVDQTAALAHQERLQAELEKVERKVAKSQAVQQYKQYTKSDYHITSTQHTAVLLRDVLGYQSVAETASGAYSTAVDVLEQIPHPIAALILKHRRLSKLKSTYIDPLVPGGDLVYPDGRIHCNFNTVFTRTGRLSSNDPNMQNMPKRKDRWVRGLIVPPPDHVILAIDYGQAEPRVVAMASRDKAFIKVLWEGYDIHEEWTDRLIKADKNVLSRYADKEDPWKELRSDVKQHFVLASLYGAQPKSVAHNLQVEEYVTTKLQNTFFEMFPDIKQWHKRIMQVYEQEGYVECLTGRRRHAPLEINKIINTTAQGTAADIVVDAMNRLSEHALETGDDTYQPTINVHDELVFEIPVEEAERYTTEIITFMIDVPYSWAKVVPIQLEAQYGYDWGEMEYLGTFDSNKWLGEAA